MSEKNPLERNLDLCLNQDRIPFSKSKEAAWIEVEKSLHKATVIPLHTKKPVMFRAIAAAGALLIGLTGTLYFLGSEQFETTKQTAQMSLPDGSNVVLNSNTAADYNSMTWIIDREVNLTRGEAFFEVEKGSTFTVNTPLGNVEVLGTSFDVLIEDEKLTVSCKTGKVKVENENTTEGAVYLEPGMKVTMSTLTSKVDEVSLDKIDAWVSGLYSFNNVAIADVFKVLENRSGKTITLPSDLNSNYTGQFSMEQPLTEILETICKPLNLEYEVNERESTILITFKK